ncbi:ABC transporter G family member 33 [Acorus calamus]|uniref:ABC transporter G family member 33 n=1 Tax=Acorus calamus TaxID=4465 RepID=A0AAV9F0C8_ACOCL|nr:ABC transporter G family member 33 [Acorus calamus]
MAETQIRSLSSTRYRSSSLRSAASSSADVAEEMRDLDEVELRWAAIERHPTYRHNIYRIKYTVSEIHQCTRTRVSLFEVTDRDGGKIPVDVMRLGAVERHVLMEKLIRHIERDNQRLLEKMKQLNDGCGVDHGSIVSDGRMILMKRGGQIIYSGPLGQHSNKLIEYFEAIPGVVKIKDNYNPATWVLEVTSSSMELQLGVDFAHLYRESLLYQNNKEMVKQLSKPPIGSEDLHFSTRYPQSGWEQFKACLWKQNLSYWRNPAYNLVRIIFMIVSSVLIGAVFWKHGGRINLHSDYISSKVFWYFYTMFSTLLYFNYFGMLLMALTPNIQNR